MDGNFHNLQLNQNSNTSNTVSNNPETLIFEERPAKASPEHLRQQLRQSQFRVVGFPFLLPAASTGSRSYYHGEITPPEAAKRKLDVIWNPRYNSNTADIGWRSAGPATPNYKHQIFEFLKAMNPNTFSSAAINSQDFSTNAHQSEAGGRLTICYADGINVYNNICPDKAKAVIDMAKNECPVTAYINSIPKWSNPAGDITDNPQKQQPQIAVPLSSALKVSLGSLPQARRASLHRFLQKRRQRLINNRVLCDANKNLIGRAIVNESTGETAVPAEFNLEAFLF